jgi:hypothetical protein
MCSEYNLEKSMHEWEFIKDDRNCTSPKDESVENVWNFWENKLTYYFPREQIWSVLLYSDEEKINNIYTKQLYFTKKLYFSTKAQFPFGR